MGRKRHQTTKQTLDVCRDLFWRQGYSQTSIKDIEKATALKPGSVYHHFKDKQTLFELTLDHYIETVIQPRAERYLFIEKGDPRENILGFFNAILKIQKQDRFGCMAVNSAFDAQNMTEVQEKLQYLLDFLESGFLFQLSRIDRRKSIENSDNSNLAGQLVLINQGFWSMVRINGSNLNIKKYLATIQALIK